MPIPLTCTAPSCILHTQTHSNIIWTISLSRPSINHPQSPTPPPSPKQKLTDPTFSVRHTAADLLRFKTEKHAYTQFGTQYCIHYVSWNIALYPMPCTLSTPVCVLGYVRLCASVRRRRQRRRRHPRIESILHDITYWNTNTVCGIRLDLILYYA